MYTQIRPVTVLLLLLLSICLHLALCYYMYRIVYAGYHFARAYGYIQPLTIVYFFASFNSAFLLLLDAVLLLALMLFLLYCPLLCASVYLLLFYSQLLSGYDCHYKRTCYVLTS